MRKMKKEGKNKTKSNIKAIIFDVGGVLELVKYSQPKRGHRTISFHQHAAKKLKINLDDWFDSIDSVYADAIEGKISEQKTMNIISKNINITRKKLEKTIIKSYKHSFKHNKKLFKTAKKLKKQGYKIAILSDQWPPSKKALIGKKYSKNFNPIIISCDVKARKPNEKIYKLLLKKIKLPAENCLFIDNRAWNLTPAKKLGMKTLLFKNNKQTIKALEKLRQNAM
jgi:putative hydrolase of the HAD superfamily